MLVHALLPKLKSLRLSGMAETLDHRAQTAMKESMAPLDFFSLLLDDELDRREQNRFRRRIKEAKIDDAKTLSHFDFAASAHVSKSLLTDLSLCRFVEKGENVLLIGPTGTGKTHIAQALANEAVKRGFQAWHQPTHTLLKSFHAGRADGSSQKIWRRLMKVDVLILDDFGLVPLTQQSVEDLYEIISERYERRPIVITSNRATEEWSEIFGNPLLASAALDRLTHHAHIIEIKGSSYRQKERQKRTSNRESTKS